MKKFLNWINKAMSWESLYKIQNIGFVKKIYIWILIVPILAKAINVINEGTAELMIFSYPIFEIGLPFSWKLFFYSALSFAVGNILYLWKCFPIIKDHKNYAEFQSVGKSTGHLEDYGEELTFRPENGIPPFFKMDEESYRITAQRAYWELRTHANLRRPKSRIFVSFFYFIGIILISCVVGKNICAVIELTF